MKIFRLLANKWTAALASIAMVLGLAGPAFAETIPADPTGGAYTGVQTSVQTWVLTIGVPVLFGLTVLGLLIRLGIKWTKRAAKAV